jgi:hypothetical protein
MSKTRDNSEALPLSSPARAKSTPSCRGSPPCLAAQAVLHTWDQCADGNLEIVEAMNGPFAALRAALATRASVSASIDASRPPKGTKHAQVVSMLSRDEGASGPQIAQAMGWAPHTVRGFLAGLAKKGIEPEHGKGCVIGAF